MELNRSSAVSSAVILTWLTFTACNPDGGSGSTASGGPSAVRPPESRTSPLPVPLPVPTGTSAPVVPPGTESTGWQLTVYYTPVESYHTQAKSDVSGSSGLIGSYPSDFINEVKNQGNGRITSGSHAGGYLNWSYDIGYWLDTAPKDAYGKRLIPFVSSAADTNVLAMGKRFQVKDCGQGIDAAFCAQVRAASWNVTDQFTPGYGGSRHIDLYIGEEDRADFQNTSPKYTTLEGAVLLISD